MKARRSSQCAMYSLKSGRDQYRSHAHPEAGLKTRYLRWSSVGTTTACTLYSGFSISLRRAWRRDEVLTVACAAMLAKNRGSRGVLDVVKKRAENVLRRGGKKAGRRANCIRFRKWGMGDTDRNDHRRVSEMHGRVRGVALAAAPRPHRPSSTSSFLPAVPIPRTSPSTPISALWCSSGSSPCFSLANSRCFCPNATLLVTGFPIHTLLLSAPRANNLSGRNTLYDIYAMLEDKYIGLSLAVSSSLAIGTSFILTKKVNFLPVYHYLSRGSAATAK